MPEKRQNRLGRGLDALLGRREEETAAEVREVDVAKIRPNRYQPRRTFDEQGLEELAASIERHGVVQPVLLRGEDDLMAAFELVAGERRWRAAQLAGLATIPAIVRPMDDETALAVSLIENLQREDLYPLEEAEAYEQLMSHFQLTQAEVAERVGKSRPYVANTVRLLNLVEEVRQLLETGVLTRGHARALLALPQQQQATVARQAVAEGWTVRRTEERCQALSGERQVEEPVPPQPQAPEDTELIALATRLGERLGTSVAIRGSQRKGTIVIDYFGTEDLERLLAVLGVLEGDAAR